MPSARYAGAALAVLLLAVAAPGAGGQDTRALTFAHDGARDGTPREVHSGFFAGDPASGDPLAARYADTYETFPVTVPAGTRHGSLRADISWADPRVNLDLSIYRLDGAGRAINPAVARSAGTGRASEAAVYAPSGTPVPPGRYLVVVDNVCSRDRDQDPRSSTPKPAACGIGQEIPDEDSFTGSVTLGNQIPSVTLEGPDRTPAKQSTTYEAVADDLDGEIVSYLFDLDGDGVYETDSDGNSKVATTFLSRGTRTIGVQVLDDSGAVALATKTVTVTRAVRAPDTRPPIISFSLSRTEFGGADDRRLVVSYRLREKARVELKLRRKGKLVRLIGRGVRKGQHTYRLVLRPAHLRRGVYTVQIFVASASGKHQVEQRSSRRR
jgi:hypothetical protein